MSDDYVPLYIQQRDRTAFLACLGIGTLYAIRQRVLPTEAGIWTLGRLNVWAPLQDDPDLPTELIEVFSTADELHAIQLLLPDRLDAIIDERIHRLEVVLAETGDSYWPVSWSPPTNEDAPPLVP